MCAECVCNAGYNRQYSCSSGLPAFLQLLSFVLSDLQQQVLRPSVLMAATQAVHICRGSAPGSSTQSWRIPVLRANISQPSPYRSKKNTDIFTHKCRRGKTQLKSELHQVRQLWGKTSQVQTKVGGSIPVPDWSHVEYPWTGPYTNSTIIYVHTSKQQFPQGDQ